MRRGVELLSHPGHLVPGGYRKLQFREKLVWHGGGRGQTWYICHVNIKRWGNSGILDSDIGLKSTW